MKKPLLYIALSILIIVMIICIWVSRESIKIQPLTKETIQEEARVKQPILLLGHVQQPEQTPVNNSAITIIQKPSPKKKVLLTPQETEEILEKTQASAPSSSNQIPTAQSSSPGSPAPIIAPGITKENKEKYPTVEEGKEMNAQGILMY